MNKKDGKTLPNFNAFKGNQDRAGKVVEKRKALTSSAEELLDKYGYFGGKRFLGINSNGTPVWISYKATDKTIEVKLTHDLFSVMPENGGEYAAERVKLWINDSTSDLKLPTYKDIADISKTNKKTGRVNKMTLLHLEKIINECEKYTRAGKKPPRDVYRLLAWNIYTGTFDSYTVPNTNWDYVAKIQGYESPEGYYFTGQV